MNLDLKVPKFDKKMMEILGVNNENDLEDESSDSDSIDIQNINEDMIEANNNLQNIKEKF